MNKKLIMTLFVRDDEDIIKYNIEFHLSHGVDFIIAADNGSTDGTRDILKAFERKGVLLLLDEKEQTDQKTHLVNRMGMIAYEKLGADIIFHCDVAEFWYPHSGNLKDEIGKSAADVLSADVINIIPKYRIGNERFPDDMRYAVVRPIVAADFGKEVRNDRYYFYKCPPKVIFKTNKKMLEVSEGNRSILNKDNSIIESKSFGISIYSYPMRGQNHNIIANGIARYNDKQRWHEKVETYLFDGLIEEFDFYRIIVGNQHKDNKWNYYNPDFEYEARFNDFDWPWAGHKNFAYDLVRNVRPGLIVELGTHKGTSFFSFCQAVKDGKFDCALNAVDTWQGDPHAGRYDDTVWKGVNEIIASYYLALNIRLHRKTFDEALPDFSDDSIDILHIDGLHTYEAVKHDFNTWLPKVKDDGIILLHDISVVGYKDIAVYELWDEIKSSYPSLEFYHSGGLGVIFKKKNEFYNYINSQTILPNYYRLKAENRRKENYLSAIYNSGSWKITYPIRKIVSFIRKKYSKLKKLQQRRFGMAVKKTASGIGQ